MTILPSPSPLPNWYVFCFYLGMSKAHLLLMAFVALLCSHASETSAVRFNIRSLKVAPAYSTNGDAVSSITFQWLKSGNYPYHEIQFPVPNFIGLQQATLTFHDGKTGNDATFSLGLDPPAQNADGSGISDAFKYEPAIEEETDASFWSLEHPQEFFRVHWHKEANSNLGTITLLPSFFGAGFTHQFELFEYAGDWHPTRVGNRTGGPVKLLRAGNTNQWMAGDLEVTTYKDIPPLLNFQLTNQLGEYVVIAQSDFANYSVRPEGNIQVTLTMLGVRNGTEYTTPFGFNDDRQCMVQLICPDDANTNGIADILEFDSKPSPPQLGISQSGTNLTLTVITDPANQTVIQFCPALPNSSWTSLDLLISTSPFQFTLPKPNTPFFWRAVLPFASPPP